MTIWDQLTEFHFLRPHLLLLTIPLLVLMAIIRNRRFKSGLWGRVCDQHLLPFLLIGKSGMNSRWSMISLGLIGVAIIIAFAGPTWEKLPQPVFRSQAALVIVLDLSRSMDVTDIKPSRLARAKHKIRDILKQRREGQTALIVYAAEAFVVTPLTEDTNTIASLVKNLSTDLMPYQGSYPEKALLKATELFKQASALNGQVLLITDGIESSAANDAIEQLGNAGHRLSILGIGTEQGAPIADYRGGFVKSQDGSIVVARMDETVLRDAAVKGGGIYQSLTANDEDVNQLLGALRDPQLDQALANESSKLKLQSDQWREEGPWILLLLLPFVALVFRRGYLVLLVAFLLPVPQTSYAFDFASLWKNSDQRAQSAMEEGDHQQAAELFNDPQWKAAASYRAENYQAALEALESASAADDPDTLYNKGNALAKLGKLQEAIESYEQALKINPNHEDARYNRDLVKEYLEKNSNQQNQKDSERNQQGNQDQQQSQGQQSQQQNQQQQQDQQDSSDNSDSQQQRGDEQNRQQADKSSQDEEQQSAQQSDKDQQQNPQDQQQQMEKHSAEKRDDSDEHQQQDQAQMVDDLSEEERRQARKTEQWLRRIPDDPGGLLRRKFRYQSELDSRQAGQERKPW